MLEGHLSQDSQTLSKFIIRRLLIEIALFDYTVMFNFEKVKLKTFNFEDFIRNFIHTKIRHFFIRTVPDFVNFIFIRFKSSAYY